MQGTTARSFPRFRVGPRPLDSIPCPRARASRVLTSLKKSSKQSDRKRTVAPCGRGPWHLLGGSPWLCRRGGGAAALRCAWPVAGGGRGGCSGLLEVHLDGQFRSSDSDVEHFRG